MPTIKSAVVGIKFHPGAHEKLIQTAAGTQVTLVREPENPYDENAVRVDIDGVICGFIPKGQAEKLAADLDAGKDVQATLEGYSQLTIEVPDDDEAESAA